MNTSWLFSFRPLQVSTTEASNKDGITNKLLEVSASFNSNVASFEHITMFSVSPPLTYSLYDDGNLFYFRGFV